MNGDCSAGVLARATAGEDYQIMQSEHEPFATSLWQLGIFAYLRILHGLNG